MRILIALLLMTSYAFAQVQVPDEATKIWALKRAYQLNGNKMCCGFIDVSKEVPGVLPPVAPPAPEKQKPKSLQELPHNAFSENTDCSSQDPYKSILKDNYQIVIQDGPAKRCYR